MNRHQEQVIRLCAEQAEYFARQLMRETDARNFMNADWFQQCAEGAARHAFAVACEAARNAA